VVAARRQGNLIYYSIANPGAIKVIHCIRGQTSYEEEQRNLDGRVSEEAKPVSLDLGTGSPH